MNEYRCLLCISLLEGTQVMLWTALVADLFDGVWALLMPILADDASHEGFV